MKTRSAKFHELKLNDVFLFDPDSGVIYVVVLLKHELIFYAHIEKPEGRRYFKSKFHQGWIEIFFPEHRPNVNYKWKRKHNI